MVRVGPQRHMKKVYINILPYTTSGCMYSKHSKMHVTELYKITSASKYKITSLTVSE